MERNLYWYVYEILEQEMIELSNYVYIDDSEKSNNLNTYSIKIADLLVRCVTEIESISKDMYYLYCNSPVDRNEDEVYFDTVCLKFFEDQWSLSKRRIDVASPRFNLTKNKNKELFPMRNAYKRGSSGASWNKAYQGRKHHRSRDLHKATVKTLLEAMAALFLLNIYYRNEKECSHVNQPLSQTFLEFRLNFDRKRGSLLFSLPTYFAVPPIDESEDGIQRLSESPYIGKFVDRCYREYYDEMMAVLSETPEFKEYITVNEQSGSLKDPLTMARAIGGWYIMNKTNQLASFDKQVKFLRSLPEHVNCVSSNEEITSSNILEIASRIGKQMYINKMINGIYGVPRRKLEQTPFTFELNKNQRVYD